MKHQVEKRDNSFLWFDVERLKASRKEIIYMDNAATTYQKPESVFWAMDEVNRCLAINAGRGSYRLAQIAVEGMDKLRDELLNLINGRNQAEVVFTSSATVAFNQIIGGLTLCAQDRVYVSPFEHNAVMRTLKLWQEKCGFSIEVIPVNVEKMQIDLEKMEYIFRQKPPTHVFVTKVSNVTGYILPTEEIFQLAKDLTNGQALVVVDGAQSFGLVQEDYQRTQYDALVFAGHKTLYGPFGIAGFIKGKQLKLHPFLAGGTGSDSLELTMPQNRNGLEPSSPNIVAMAGLYAAVQFLKKETIQSVYQHEKRLTEQLVKELKNISGVKLYIPQERNRHIGIVSFTMEGYRSEEVGMILDEDYHIAVRTGYHCAPLIHDYIKSKEYGGTVRVGLSYFSRQEEVEKLSEAVRRIALEG